MSILEHAQTKALALTGQEILNDLRDSYTMPFDTGTMQNDQTYLDDSKSKEGVVKIVTDAPQARRLYYHPEYDFQRGNNPNAGAYWFDPYVDGVKSKKVAGWFKKFIKMNGGGYIE